MRATDLSELAAFDAVARHLSFRRAAEERGVTPSAISHAVSNLEDRVGIRLLNRTTRSVSLTDAGAMLIARLTPAFDEIGAALDVLNQFRDTPFGKVRINAPNSIAPYVLKPVFASLVRRHPNLQLEVVATDRLVDIVADGFDAGIRLGESLHPGMTAVKLKQRLRFAVVGSPDYFKAHAAPKTPADLTKHVCIRSLYPNGTPYEWSFAKGGVEVQHWPEGPVALDDHDLMVEAARAGVGLAYVWEKRAEREIADGQLVRCLSSWCGQEEALYLYYPTRKYISAGLRAVIDTLRA